jgi:hypothetical protein
MNDIVTLSPDAQPLFGSTRHIGSVSEPRPPNGCSPWVRPFPPRLPPGVASRCSVASQVLWPHPTSHPRTCSAYGLSPSRAGPAHECRAWMRPPRFRAKNFSTCTRSPTARGSSHASHSPWDDVAFSSTERDRHLGIRPVSQLNTWPVVSPVNASRRPSRDAAHHSGSGRLARPSPWGTLTSYSLPAFLAHSVQGHLRRFDGCRSISGLSRSADAGISPLAHILTVATSR